jgi:hypothetical protein
MMSPRTFRPDLNDAVLEDRTLMAYSPFVPPLILTTGGYIALSTPPGLSANLNTTGGGAPGGGAVGGGGGNMGTAFYNTGFGVSQISIGNATGFAGVGLAGAGGGGGTVRPTTTVGSGASEGGGAGASVSRNTVAQGGSAAMLDLLYIGQTSSSGDTDSGGYAGPGNQGPAPVAPSAPVPPAPPPSL